LNKGTLIIKATGRKEDNINTTTISELLAVAVKKIILKEQFSGLGEANKLGGVYTKQQYMSTPECFCPNGDADIFLDFFMLLNSYYVYSP